MIPKHIVSEIERLKRSIAIKKERIDKLHRLEKLKKNEDLISEYDSIINQADSTISAILESKELMDAHKEQVILHSTSHTRLMAKGLKSNLCDSSVQITYLNNAIQDDNNKISELQKENKTHGGIV